jgi:hypothetical protein
VQSEAHSGGQALGDSSNGTVSLTNDHPTCQSKQGVSSPLLPSTN